MKTIINYSRVNYEKRSRKPSSTVNFEGANVKKLEHSMHAGFSGDIVPKKLEVGDRCQIFSIVLGIIGN